MELAAHPSIANTEDDCGESYAHFPLQKVLAMEPAARTAIAHPGADCGESRAPFPLQSARHAGE